MIECGQGYGFCNAVVPFESGGQMHGIIAPQPEGPCNIISPCHEGLCDAYSYIGLPLADELLVARSGRFFRK